MINIEVGKLAPEFTLYNDRKEKVKLSQLRGKNVLLLFFPAAYTSVCTDELCSMRDNLDMYNNLNAEIFGISVDTVYTLARYKSDYLLNFDLLSDFNKEVSTMYNSIYELFGPDMRGVSKRSAFLIDKNGVIQYAEVLENAGDLPNFAVINEKLNQLN
jgi:glutaredoxin-dependent peroxiredoxin